MTQFEAEPSAPREVISDVRERGADLPPEYAEIARDTRQLLAGAAEALRPEGVQMLDGVTPRRVREVVEKRFQGEDAEEIIAKVTRRIAYPALQVDRGIA